MLSCMLLLRSPNLSPGPVRAYRVIPNQLKYDTCQVIAKLGVQSRRHKEYHGEFTQTLLMQLIVLS